MATTLKTLDAWEKRLSREQKALDRRERWLRADQRRLQARWERLSAKRQALLDTLPLGPEHITDMALKILHQKLEAVTSARESGFEMPAKIGTSLRIRLPVSYTISKPGEP